MKKLLSFLLVMVLAVTLAGCKADGDVPIDVIQNCIENPSDPSCQEIIPGDDRTPEEILADQIIENWDGELTHINLLMASFDFSSSMQLETEYDLSVENGVGEVQSLNLVVTDSYVYGNYDLMQRDVVYTLNTAYMTEPLVIEGTVIVEEVATGVIVYFNTEYIRGIFAEQGITDVDEVLTTLGATEDWFMFSFDDSLANIVELGVLKEMVLAAFFDEVGETFFYSLQDEIELDLGFDFEYYGVDLGLFVDYLVDEDFVAAETLLINIQWEDLVLGLDIEFLVPEIVYQLQANESAIYAINPSFLLVDHVNFLQNNGTEAWLNNLTELEIATFLEVFGDPQLRTIYEEYLAGTLDHYLVMQFLTDPDVALELQNIPGFDYTAFLAVMDVLDYQALYAEDVDINALIDAIYMGQTAFDTFVTTLDLTAHETAKMLAPWSGTVLFLEDYMVIVDDINYGLTNLNVFDVYFTIDYYLDNQIIGYAMDKNEDFDIVTTITLDGSAFTNLFVDVLDEVYWYVDGFELVELPFVDYLNCPVGETTCEEFPQYQDMLDILAEMGDMEVTMEYNPTAQDEMTMTLDVADMMNAMMEMDEYNDTTILSMSISVTERENAAVTVPTTVTDVNAVAEDFAKFSLVMQAYDYMQQTVSYYTYSGLSIPDFGTVSYLSAFDSYFRPSAAFDENLSTVEVTGDILAIDYEIDLYWIDGTPVFDSPLTYSMLMTVLGPNTGAPTATQYNTYVDMINDDNFNMTKLFLVYVMADNNN